MSNLTSLPSALIDACCCFFGLDHQNINIVDDYWKVTPLQIISGVDALFNKEFIPRFPEFKFSQMSDFWMERYKIISSIKNNLTHDEEKMFNTYPLLVGVTGEMRHGKSTLTAELVRRYGFVEYAFAQPLKHGCAVLFDFTDEQLYGEQKEQVDARWGITPRKVLQTVGTDLFRNLLHLYVPALRLKHTLWIENFIRWQSLHKTSNVVVSDVRFVDECEIIHQMNGTVVRIVRPSLSNRTDQKHAHASETAISMLPVDHTIVNDSSLDMLNEKIKECVEKLVKEKTV